MRPTHSERLARSVSENQGICGIALLTIVVVGVSLLIRWLVSA